MVVVKRYIAPSRLATLVDRPGGKRREEAIADATRNLESVRGSSMDVIEELVAEIERRCGNCVTAPLAERPAIEYVANQIITLAGTFGLLPLSEACKRLCDLVSAAEMRPELLARPLAIHARAIRLLAPKSVALDATSAMLLLSELRKVLEHFGVPMPKEAKVD